MLLNCYRGIDLSLDEGSFPRWARGQPRSNVKSDFLCGRRSPKKRSISEDSGRMLSGICKYEY